TVYSIASPLESNASKSVKTCLQSSLAIKSTVSTSPPSPNTLIEPESPSEPSQTFPPSLKFAVIFKPLLTIPSSPAVKENSSSSIINSPLYPSGEDTSIILYSPVASPSNKTTPSFPDVTLRGWSLDG